MARADLTRGSETRRAPPAIARAPLLWLVLPLMAGIASGQWAGPVVPTWIPILCAFGLITLAVWCLYSKSRDSLALALVGAGMVLFGFGWLWERSPPALDAWRELPPREVAVELRVDRLQPRDDPYGRVSGRATIVGVPEHLEDLRDQPLQFLLTPRVDVTGIQPGSRIASRGQLDYLPARIPKRIRALDTDDSEVDKATLRSWLDYDRYLVRSGVRFSLSRGYVEERVNAPPAWRLATARWAQAIDRQLHLGTHDERTRRLADLSAAMALGRKDRLSLEQRAQFSATGVMHLFAISGLHVGIVAVLVFFALRLLLSRLFARRVRLGRLTEFLCGSGILLVYVAVTGFPPSAVRAWLMVSAFWSSRVVRRRGAPMAALSASALLVLIWEPRQLFDLGFQLSYAVVAGILLYGAPLAESANRRWTLWADLPNDDLGRVRRWLRGLRDGSVQLLAISLAALCLSAPLTVGAFNILAPMGLLLNLLLVPLAGVALTGALLSTGFGLASLAGVGAFINHGTWLILWLMEGVVQSVQGLPASAFILQWRAAWLSEAVLVVLLGLLLYRPFPSQAKTFPWTSAALLPGVLITCLLLGSVGAD
ncbi:MAG: ComEC/Rec2 family competence protein [Opitutales bacterium]